MKPDACPSLIVFSNLFPHSGTPGAGLFIRERLFRVGKALPVTVVVPIPWFPLQSLIRVFRPHFRPKAPHFEVQEGVEIILPRFFSIPGLFKAWDGFFMALGSLHTLRRLRRQGRVDIIDAHFAYPNGYAAVLLGGWLGVPVTITLRGTEVSLSADPARRQRILKALEGAATVFSVSDSLRRHVIALGADSRKLRVVGNGVDLTRFYAEDRGVARARLNLPQQVPILISVGGLVERKGFHRVIECLPRLLGRYPELHYLIVGGPSPEGDISTELRRQVSDLGLQDRVRFLGPLPPAELRWPLSAADAFVLATRNEGWANVFLEAMACGLPVVTTDVGGNAEVICRPDLGIIVPFGESAALAAALTAALNRRWDREAIVRYARENTWEQRVETLLAEFRALAVNSNSSASDGSTVEDES